MYPRDEHDVADEGNPVTAVHHLKQYGTDACLGLNVWLWCPGCQALHSPRFRCPDHEGPLHGPTWSGDPYSDPFTMSPSLLVRQGWGMPRCHSYVRYGQWEYLPDCTHKLKGQSVPLEPLPNWLVHVENKY